MSSLYVAAGIGDLKRVQELVEQGADKGVNCDDWTPLMIASYYRHLEVVRYLLEQGANTDKANNLGYTSLHYAASQGHLEVAKLLMVYGADLNARTFYGQSPIDLARNEEMKQAIRDEPERRWDQQPRKRCIEEDRQPNTAASTSAQQEDDEGEQGSKQSAVGEAVEGEVAEEDQDSEPSSDEDNN